MIVAHLDLDAFYAAVEELENPELPASVRQDCALVVGEIDRMSAKLAQLLQYSKQATPPVNGDHVEAMGLARKSVEFFRRDAARRGVRLDFDGGANGTKSEVFVRASAEALNEMLANLVLNAVEAQPAGGDVHVGIASADGMVDIVVQDDGPGIPMDMQEKIFQPFYTTKASGTGLGLSIVARRAAEMGAEVLCESPVTNGRGSRFRIRIPATKSEQ